jgi:GH43 family beta-xylosidase
MQQFNWKMDGSPDFGVPVKEGIEIPVPSSAKALRMIK